MNNMDQRTNRLDSGDPREIIRDSFHEEILGKFYINIFLHYFVPPLISKNYLRDRK